MLVLSVPTLPSAAPERAKKVNAIKRVLAGEFALRLESGSKKPITNKSIAERLKFNNPTYQATVSSSHERDAAVSGPEAQ